MLVKFFQYGAVKKGQKGHSGGGGAVKNYLLGKNFDKGEIREGATLFRGDPNETTQIINGIERQSYYKSGVLSFTQSDSQKLTDDDLNAIIDDFEKTMFPTFEPDQYSGYWVKHTDKDRLELHFVYAEEELTSGYGLNVYVAKIDKPLVDSWKDLTNDKYELDDPNAPDHKRERTVTKGFELKKGYEPKYSELSDEQLKNQIHERIFAYAEFMANIENRDDIINSFKELGYKVTSKPNSKYISIEHPDQKNHPDKKLKNLRFKDGIYSKDFNRSMLNKDKSYEQREYERKRPERIAKAQKIYDSSLQKRIERMTHRYRNIERKPLDNQLTHDLKQIQAKSEPNFLKQVAEYQRQELKKIIGQSIEQIYKQHEHDQPERLVSLKELHQILIDDIDNQLKDEPLPQFDQIIENYQNSKNHIVTFDSIEHDRHQAQLEQQQAEIVVVPKQPEPTPEPPVRLSLAEQRARNRAKQGQDELTPEQRVAKAFAEQRAKAQTQVNTTTPDTNDHPEQLKQAKLLALMQQNQESERQAKLEQQQAQREREARQARRQAQLEALKNKHPEPSPERLLVNERSDKEVAQATPEPPPPQSTIEEKRRWSGRVLLYQNIQKIKKDFSVAVQVKATADNMPDDKLLDPLDKGFDVMLDNGITLRDDINRIADEFNANKEKLAQQATRTTEPVKIGGLDR